LGKRFGFISEERGSRLVLITLDKNPWTAFNYRLKNGEKRTREISLTEFIDIKGWKAAGNKITGFSRISGFKFIKRDIEEIPQSSVNPEVPTRKVEDRENTADEDDSENDPLRLF